MSSLKTQAFKYFKFVTASICFDVNT